MLIPLKSTAELIYFIAGHDWDVLVKHSLAPLDLKPVDAIFGNLYPAFECQRRDSSWFLTLVPETHICHPGRQ